MKLSSPLHHCESDLAHPPMLVIPTTASKTTIRRALGCCPSPGGGAAVGQRRSFCYRICPKDDAVLSSRIELLGERQEQEVIGNQWLQVRSFLDLHARRLNPVRQELENGPSAPLRHSC